MRSVEICIVGAGLIGASLALELADRGRSVTLLTASEPLSDASAAAAGMLAVDDPDNPAALHPLATRSRDLYPAFLDRLHSLGGQRVQLQTLTTLQELAGHHHESSLHPLTTQELHERAPQLRSASRRFALLAEASLDPRELAAATRAALTASRLELATGERVHRITESAGSVHLSTSSGDRTAELVVDCTGAWTLPRAAALLPTALMPVAPRKGQLLTVTLPPSLQLASVVRTPSVYIVPRLHGAQAGRAVIGASVEDRGFDTAVEPATIRALQAAAAELFPELAHAVVAETWAGLRPATADGLPLLGRVSERTYICKGHYRNGILLAPATARVMAELLSGDTPSVALDPFRPDRPVSPSHGPPLV